MESAKKNIDENTKIVSFCHFSNSIGIILPVKELVELARAVGAVSIVDAAQSVAHVKLDVKQLDCDFLVFSGHKMYGPTGIGVLFGKKERLENLDPFVFGGDMIREVTYKDATWNDLPWRLEAGTPNIAGGVGLGAAVDFVEDIGYDVISKHEKSLVKYAIDMLKKVESLKIIGSLDDQTPVVSFTIDRVHSHDIGTILDKSNVAVRTGHHCTMPLMKYLELNGTTRASFGVYNTKEDIDKLVRSVKDVIKIFN